ncbi:MAG: putative sulfate exporter family transporter [Microbacteriaceae bacterium]|nr:putative sulfate exporter family transporter [Microbacteriaceae bacterium]MCL2795997.1 putative sulfate exporter family transporter [Microbacteriaceae bacterium]
MARVGFAKRIPGLVLCIAVALVATGLGRLVPVIGAPVFGILIGALVASFLRPGARTDAGAGWAGKYVLQASVVVLGSGLSLAQVLNTGWHSLPIMLGTLTVALGGGWLIGRALGLPVDVRTLIAVGTGICGASAIAATQSVIRAKANDVAYAIGTIFTFNVVAVLAFPFIGHALGLSDHAFGLWAGTAINDTSSVVAAAFSFSPAAGDYGIIVKLTRTLMIIPITIAIAVYRRRQAARAAAVSGADASAPVPWSWKSVVPQFLIWFVVVVIVNSLGLIPAAWHPALSTLGTFMITAALTGIGLGTRLRILKQAGIRPLALGALLWVLVALASLGLQLVTGNL